MSPEEQRAADVAWLEEQVCAAEASAAALRLFAESEPDDRFPHILAALSAQQEPPPFTDEHARGLAAVKAKLERSSGPVVLSWDEAEAVLDFAETALRVTGWCPKPSTDATPHPEQARVAPSP